MTNAVIAIAGSSGLIGSALTSTLRASDHRVLRLVRRKPGRAERREESPGRAERREESPGRAERREESPGRAERREDSLSHPDDVFWNPDTGDCDPEALRGVDAVVNLCGVNVGSKRWSGAFKQSLRDSRIGPTEVLSHAVADADVPVLINASAVGYYGDTRDRIVDETAPAGDGFLAGLCEDWETATATAQQSGARVVLARTGLVLGPSGGVLNRLKPLFSFGLGGRLGNGRQYMPWISLSDEVRALQFAIEDSDVSGPVNLTGPAPVTNAEFTSALGRVVNRPAALQVPGFALRAVLGEFADEGLLGGQRAIPAVLERAGFEFHHNTIGEALAYSTAPDHS